MSNELLKMMLQRQDEDSSDKFYKHIKYEISILEFETREVRMKSLISLSDKINSFFSHHVDDFYTIEYE